MNNIPDGFALKTDISYLSAYFVFNINQYKYKNYNYVNSLIIYRMVNINHILILIFSC